MQDGKGMKKRKGHDLDPEQDLEGNRVVVSAMSEPPGLGQFIESVVFNLPPQVA